MGLSNQSDTRKTYLNVVGGKFALQAKRDTEGAVSRTNKKGVEVWEVLYDKLENVRLKSISKKTDDYGAKWELVLTEAADEFVLNLPYSSRITNGFTHRLPNIDLRMDMTLSLFTNNESKTYLTVKQDDTKVEPAYTKDNPNGLPQMKQIKVKGVDTWDDTEALEFIENMIETLIQPRLKMLSEPQATPVSQDDSGLPF